MNMDIKIPHVPPNYTDDEDDDKLIICDIHVSDRQFVYKNSHLFDVETNKVVLEVVAPESGTIQAIKIEVGQIVETDKVAMKLDTSAKEPLPNILNRVINMEFLTGLMLGSIITYVILKVV